MTDDTDHFTSIPWVAAHLKDLTFKTITMPSRITKSTTEDSFFSKTLNSRSTMSHCLTQYRLSDDSEQKSQPNTIPTSELRIFCTLGSDLDGYAGILHGGMVSTLLDECMGLVLSFSLGGGQSGQKGPVTAYLNTRYRGPIKTPGTVVVSGRIVEGTVGGGRKWKMQGDIRDGEGRALAEGECLYVLPRGGGGGSKI